VDGRRGGWWVAGALLLATTLVASCSSGTKGQEARPAATSSSGSGTTATTAKATPDANRPAPLRPKARWTVLVYLDADNNIEADLLRDVERMAEVGSSDDLNVIVLADRSPDDNSYSPGPGQQLPDGDLLGIPNFDDAKLLRIGKGTAEVVQDLGEISMGDAQTLSWFTYTGIALFPADHYALVLDDHGGATLSMQDDSDPPGPDGLPPILTLDKVGQALQESLSLVGVPKLDFFGYDACLMAGYDAIGQLTPYARWFVGAEEETIGPQWDFVPMLQAVATAKDATGEDMGRAIVDQVVAAVPYYPNATMTLVDLDKVAPLTQALGSFADTLSAQMTDAATDLGRARANALEFGVDPSGQGLPFDMVDLGDLVRRLDAAPPAVQTAGNAVFAAIGGAVADLAQGPAETQSTGISIYFPPTVDRYQSFLGQVYANQPSAAAWNRMLRTYFDTAGGGVQAAAPTFASPDATLAFSPQGVLVSADLVGDTVNSVVDAQLLAGRPDADGLSFDILVVEPAGIGAGGASTIAAGWDFSTLQVGDGTTTLDASVILEPVAGALKGRIPLVYQAPDGTQAEAVIEFSVDPSGAVTGTTLLRFEDDGTVAQLAPEPGSVLAPLVLVASAAGDVTPQLLGNQALDATAAIGFVQTRLPAGSPFIVALLASDAGGNTAATFGSGTVP
jgi:Clostripain family